ncbi:hypothetical protein [Aquibacillus rhizosphaerae]|uniref:Uncharacterized protein n=1 Tax=Aquibacillus rhizosphaerae TaxID=3051431 RepID=A0ABT7L479_9BACI|nr:hypothetical protein [Aquibacillus sp. LR5S19]MDL4839410.1 hypothetical protein [Aquibacillus sp. LR5S19]
MTTFGFVTIVIILLIILSAAIILFVKTPTSKVRTHMLAITPLLLGVAYIWLLPDDLLYTNDSTSTFFSTVIPIGCIVFSLPLIIKAKKEIKNKEY